jgi:hypothetical protein
MLMLPLAEVSTGHGRPFAFLHTTRCHGMACCISEACMTYMALQVGGLCKARRLEDVWIMTKISRLKILVTPCLESD